MRNDLLWYYERELGFIREMGAEFAEKYPKVAGRLLLEPDACEDPHVERLIEAFAILTGRVRLKIDDEFPEVTESLLNVLYPHYLAPVPSMSIVEFQLDPHQGKLTTSYTIEKETTLFSKPIQGTPCRFRTSYPVTLWPIEIVSATLDSRDPVDTRGRWAEAELRLSMRCTNKTALSKLKVGGSDPAEPIERLRFYLNGEPAVVHALYELLFNNVTDVELRETEAEKRGAVTRKPASVVRLSPENITAVGFETDEGMLPYTARSFAGYRLLTEYFAFPQKFLFFDVTGLDEAARAGFGSRFDIAIRLRDVVPLGDAVDAKTFRLGCAPIVNLFTKIAEPIQLTQTKTEYHVVPDVHRQMATEVYSIDSVTSTDPYLREHRHFEPFYSYRHARAWDPKGTFWYATRRPSELRDDVGTEVYLSLVDLGFDPTIPAIETITTHVTCTNRDLPSKLPFGDRNGDFELEAVVPLSRVQCLVKPTPTLRPALRRGAHWRLISHLTLNYLSIVGDRDGSPDALREVLALYDFTDSTAIRRQIEGIRRVKSGPAVRQIRYPQRIGAGYVRGIETTIDFDEERFVGSGLFLFASVLERFLGLYASVNSFTMLSATSSQREGYVKRWPARVGERILL